MKDISTILHTIFSTTLPSLSDWYNNANLKEGRDIDLKLINPQLAHEDKSVLKVGDNLKLPAVMSHLFYDNVYCQLKQAQREHFIYNLPLNARSSVRCIEVKQTLARTEKGSSSHNTKKAVKLKFAMASTADLAKCFSLPIVIAAVKNRINLLNKLSNCKAVIKDKEFGQNFAEELTYSFADKLAEEFGNDFANNLKVNDEILTIYKLNDLLKELKDRQKFLETRTHARAIVTGGWFWSAAAGVAAYAKFDKLQYSNSRAVQYLMSYTHTPVKFALATTLAAAFLIIAGSAVKAICTAVLPDYKETKKGISLAASVAVAAVAGVYTSRGISYLSELAAQNLAPQMPNLLVNALSSNIASYAGLVSLFIVSVAVGGMVENMLENTLSSGNKKTITEKLKALKNLETWTENGFARSSVDQLFSAGKSFVQKIADRLPENTAVIGL